MYVNKKSFSWEINKEKIQSTGRKMNFSTVCIISLYLLFAGYLQFVPKAAEAGLTFQYNLDDKLENMESQSKDLREQIWELKKRAKNTENEM